MFHESRHLVGSIHARYVVHFNILKNSSSIVSYRPFFEAKAGAKIKPFSLHFQIFFKVFFNFFFRSVPTSLFSAPFCLPSLLKAGAKIRQLNPSFQTFIPLFFIFFTTYCSTVNCKLSFSRLTLHRRLKRKRSVFLPRKSSIGYNTCNKQTDQRIYRKNEPFYSNFFTFVIYENSKIS